MSVFVGDHLGPYEILAPIGAGGMGEVYRARDTKLGRDVALKVLPAAFAHDADRMARFEREARVLASLNHPNIAQIYGVEERALVMELVEGEHLKGPLPVETALNYAKQIAEALEAAHEKGIVHRDLKPANIMITATGVIKMLDFGLAKASEELPPSDNGANSPTLTMSPTRAGMIMGTAAYMSPEQASGKPVDKRADIWSFGLVLYEMLTGQRLFESETISHTLADVLRGPIDFSKLPQKTPATIRDLLSRCLDRDVKNRLRDIGEARIAIHRAEKEPEAVAQVTPDRRPWLWPGVAALLLLGLGTPTVLYFRRKPPTPELVQFQIVPPEKPATNSYLYLSPDGRQLLFNGMGPTGGERLWVRALDSLESRPLAGTQGPGNPSENPFWSADSRFIAFSEGGKLKKIAAAGGLVQIVCDTPDGDTGGGAWNQNGVIIIGSQSHGLFRVSSSGGLTSPLTILDPLRQEASHRRPVFLPDGRHFLYLRLSVIPDNSGVFVGSLDVKAEEQSRRRLLPGGIGVAYAGSSDPDIGYILFLQDDTLMAQRFGQRRLELTGDPVPVAEQVGFNGATTGYFSASAMGVLAYRSSTGANNLIWFDRQGKALGSAADSGQYGELNLSPEGTRVAVAGREGSKGDIWLLDLARGARTRFTFDPVRNHNPVWSPDGTQIVFASPRNGGLNSLYRKPASGAGEEQLLLQSNGPKFPQDWSRDGRFLLFEAYGGKSGSADLWVLPVSTGTPGEAQPTPFLATPFIEANAQFSPDGQWVAYSSNESGRPEVYVRPFPASSDGGKWVVSNGGGSWPRWRRDGKELFYLSPDDKLMSVEVSAGPTFKSSVPKPLFAVPALVHGFDPGWHWDVAPDGQRFLIETVVGDMNSSAMTVVLNWTGLQRK